MTDAISRSAVLKKMDELIDFAYRNEDDDLHHTLVTVCSYIDEIPTLDAVPVVRCKDCRKRGSYPCPMFLIAHDCTEDDGFCHLGARMDGEAE